MGESLTEQRRVSDDGLRVVKLCLREKTGRVPTGLFRDGTLKENTG